jgi:hypothetical protein
MGNLASSWSFPSDLGTPFLVGELTTQDRTGARPEPQRSGRKAPRVHVELGAGLRQRGGSGISVQIVDLSTEGFRAQTHLVLAAGADVWLRLPGLEACHAKVMWTKGTFIGCAFERPLHPAVLDMVVSKSGRA